jgi:shikimate kinase
MSRNHILYIIGFMGSGKTTAGKRLASLLNWSFIDLDKKIEEYAALKIPEIFSLHGEDHFRMIEAEVLRSLVTDSDSVISTGGGTPCYAGNMEFMLETGFTIYLKLTPGQLMSRLESSSDERPLIRNLEGENLLNFIGEKLSLREKWYEKSDLVVNGFDLDINSLHSIVKLQLSLAREN